MRNNFLGGTSSTGGTGALTLTAASGLALPAVALVGGQSVEYAILEFTDSTLSTISKSESGWGSMSSGNVLTRSKPSVTWDGTQYTQSGATALSFGTSNVRVYFTPLAEGGSTAYPMRANFVGAYVYGPNEWVIGANFADGADYSPTVLTANLLYMVPTRLEPGYALTSLGVSVTTAASGKSLSACIAVMDPANFGVPGVVLQTVNGLSVGSTGIISGSVTGKINAPGWYWTCFVSDGTPSLLGSVSQASNPIGGFATNTTRMIRYATRSKTYGAFSVGTSAMTGSSGSAVSIANAAAPLLLMR